MTIEAIQNRATTIVHYSLFVGPILIILAVVCTVFRRARWIAPVWTFLVCPVVIFLLLLLYMFAFTLGMHGPDSGFVGMGTMFILLFSLFEVIPGVALLLAYPRGSAWTPRTRFLSSITAFVSSGTFLFFLPRLPVHQL